MTIVDFAKEGDIGTALLPKRYDIKMYQGDTFEVVFQFRDALNVAIDLTGVTYVSKFKGISPAADPATQPAVSCPTPASGDVTFLILDTATLEGDYHWDLQLVSAGKKRTYIGGVVTVTTDITP